MQFFSTLEREAQRRLQPLFQRLDFVPAQEVRGLSRRIRQLERYVRLHESARGQLPRAEAGPAVNSLEYADLFWDEV